MKLIHTYLKMPDITKVENNLSVRIFECSDRHRGPAVYRDWHRCFLPVAFLQALRHERSPCPRQGAGHSLGPVVAEMVKLTGVEARRIHVDKGYRGHNHPHKFRV